MDAKSISRNTNCLLERIKNNISANNFNFNEWIFSNVKIPNNAYILELCCGTGEQTRYLAKKQNKGIYILDISKDALNASINKCKKYGTKINPIYGSLDNLQKILPKNKKFSLCFCSYGLYYAKNTESTLDAVKNRLDKNGKITIVAPYGENNKELFSFLQNNGVKIDEKILYSTKYMESEVIPYMIKNFKTISINTVENPVVWNSANDVMRYWENTTFYDEFKRKAISVALDRFFKKNKVFINTKHIMCAEAGV